MFFLIESGQIETEDYLKKQTLQISSNVSGNEINLVFSIN